MLVWKESMMRWTQARTTLTKSSKGRAMSSLMRTGKLAMMRRTSHYHGERSTWTVAAALERTWLLQEMRVGGR